MPLRASSPAMVLLASLVVPGAIQAAGPPINDPAATVRAVLGRSCGRCHGELAKPKGGLGNITDLRLLLDKGQIIPGKPQQSPLFQRIASYEMPPYGTQKEFQPAHAAVIRRWIASGAVLPVHDAKAIAEADLLPAITADLEALPARERRFMRYLTLGHLARQPLPERLALQYGLTKLVNSLSWHARLSVPHALPDARVFRIDLRHYRWTARQWDRLAAAYPYAPRQSGLAAARLAEITGSDRPFVRADWFVATASRPPAYHDFLGLPSTDRALERLVQTDTASNIEEDTAIRAGFNGSGVAKSNRIIERHDSAYGAYWRSFDFSDNTDRQNIFSHPLGPTPGAASFRHAGGEIIFHLPNGLQGYLLVDASGKRLDRAPGEIVTDPKRPDRLVENGLSCMGCHVQGIIPKDDQVRPHLLKNARAFSEEATNDILALYASSSRMKKHIREDNERFAVALRKLGVPAGEPEPILAIVLRYEETLTLQRAADELGVTTERLAEKLRADNDLGRTFGPLRTRGTVQRQVFEEAFPRLLEVVAEPASLAVVPSPKGPFRGHRGAVRALAWAPDGKQFASAGEDGEVRVWDLAAGQSRILGKHSDEVYALAFSPDGKRLLSAGVDRVVRLWDVQTGKRLAQLVGHTAAVRAVVFSPAGTWAASAGEDRSIRIWDLEKSTQRRALTGHTGTITALAVRPDGKTLLSGSTDRTARLWRIYDGRQVARFDHTGEVHATAFSSDGRMFATAGADHLITIRGADKGEVIRRITGLEGTIIGVMFVEADRQIVSITRKSSLDSASLQRHQLADVRRTGVGGPSLLEAGAIGRDGRILVAVRDSIEIAWTK